jgi:hypothetical protein
MRDELKVDYERGLLDLREESYGRIVAVILDEMPHAWHARYKLMCTGPTNVLRLSAGGYEYLFDYTTELGVDREDRLVVAFGRSRRAGSSRDASRIRGFPGSDDRGDRGHFLAHAAGGGLDINLFHQEPRLNRGWSPEGKEYRRMEEYIAKHDGTLCFSRPIYEDDTARPAELEFGVLRPDLRFWVGVFANTA